MNSNHIILFIGRGVLKTDKNKVFDYIDIALLCVGGLYSVQRWTVYVKKRMCQLHVNCKKKYSGEYIIL